MELDKLIEQFRNERLQEPTQYIEPSDNRFDAPIPGQSLTDEPGNYPWEHPPQYTDVIEASEFVWDRLHRPAFTEQVLAMLDAGIPVEALGRIIIFNGFMEGKWNPDLAFLRWISGIDAARPGTRHDHATKTCSSHRCGVVRFHGFRLDAAYL